MMNLLEKQFPITLDGVPVPLQPKARKVSFVPEGKPARLQPHAGPHQIHRSTPRAAPEDCLGRLTRRWRSTLG